MRKEFVVIRIDSIPDGNPQILVSLVDPKDARDRGVQRKFGGSNVMGSFGSMDDMMKNINKMFTGQTMGDFTTNLKLSIKEYQESGIKIGDKIYLDITKSEQDISKGI
ncbi:MAG: hypothetical protein CMO16_00920 [Thaumarchaeota archaeon]|nr:hypothetical protein [Nitrososphaerota archaeon]|tara:strand:+ start:338 stop:661 length:324 start_codon:yes stop_codon:yes gene_type:complete